MPKFHDSEVVENSNGSISAYGMEWPYDTDELTIHLWCYKHDERSEGSGKGERGTRWHHFKWCVDLLWNLSNSPRKVVWNPWSDKMFNGMIDYDYIGIAGCGSCVSGDTKMLDPITNESPTIKELCDQNKRPTVMTLHGPVKADVPYLKGRDRLYEFELEDGSKIKCTAKHRFLVEGSWMEADQVEVGSAVFGYDSIHQETTSDDDLLNLQPDVPRWMQKPEDYRGDYFAYYRLCGEQLRLARESALESPLQQADARKCSGYASSHSGDSCGVLGCNHPYQSISLSTDSASHLCSHPQSYTLSQSHYSLGTSSHENPLSQQSSQSQQENNLLWTSLEQVPYSSHTLSDLDSLRGSSTLSPNGTDRYTLDRWTDLTPHGLASCSCVDPKDLSPSSCVAATPPSLDNLTYLNVGLSKVVSKRDVGVEDYYDLNVPVEHHYFANGYVNHNSGKSDSAAVFAIVEYLAYPIGTLVLITSTTIKDAQKRVWKSVAELWNSLDDPPGFMIQSKAMIAGIGKNGEKTVATGLQIVAAQKGTDENKMEMAGQKAECLILIADELPELTHGVLRTAFANLSQGSTGIVRPDGTNRETPFKMIAMGNPSTYTDPFGKFCEPQKGWKNITEQDWEWETSRGICMRFDASESPNIKAGKRIYPWMPTLDIINKARQDFGEKSRIFFRMYKGFWFPDGDTDTIYSESEIIKSDAHKDYEGDDVVNEIAYAGADPAFSSGGDRFPIVYGRILERSGGKESIVQVDGVHFLKEDITDTTTPRSHDMARQMRDFCASKNIHPSNLGYDITGAGLPFRDVVVAEWSSLPLGIKFGGSPSTLPVSMVDPRKSSEVYANRVSELWVRGAGLIREGLIHGLSNEMIEEMIQRRWDKNNHGRFLKVESKSDMKMRTGQSPDICDALFCMLETIVHNGAMTQFETSIMDDRITPTWEKNIDVHSIGDADSYDLDYSDW